MEPNELVSVVVPTHNRCQSLRICLDALRAQSYRNLQIIVADDGSTDRTAAIVSEIIQSDPRIELARSPTNNGPAAARNRGFKRAQGDFIFFADDDVVVPPHWVAAGLRIFEQHQCAGIEGQIIYVSDTYRPRYSDHVVENRYGDNYMAGNIAYRKEVLQKAGLFNESFRSMEDRDLAIRVLKYGTIVFSLELKAAHARQQRTIRSFFREARTSAGWAQFNLANNKRDRMLWIIHQPHKLLTLACPPLIFVRRFGRRFAGPIDYLLLLMLYPRLWYERILVWRWAIRYRQFII